MNGTMHISLRSILLSIIFAVLLAAFLLPASVHAALFGFDFIVCGKDRPDCNLGHVFQLIDMLVKFALYLSIPITVILMSWAGIKYLIAAGDQKKLADAKGMLQNVAFGIFFILIAYLVIHSIYVYFVRDEFRQFGI